MKRLGGLDFARVAAMLGVVMIHVSSGFLYAPMAGGTVFGMNLAFFLNQIVRFSVPMFVLLSGTALGLRPEQPSVGRFWWKRFRKLGIPYLIWSFVYILYNARLSLGAVFTGDFLKTWLLGYGASHLYFVVVMAQLYLLYPALKRWAERRPGQMLAASFLITFGTQKLFDFRGLGLDLIPGWLSPYLWFLFPTWLFYFALGMALTPGRLEKVMGLCRRNRVTLCVVTAVVAVLYALDARTTGNVDSIKGFLNLYTPLVLAALLGLWPAPEGDRAGSRLTRVTEFFAKHSMTIYFDHVLILMVLRRFAVFQGGLRSMALLYVAVLALGTAAAVVIDGAVGWVAKRLRRREVVKA